MRNIRFFLLTSFLSRPQFVYSNVGDFKPWRLARLCKTCLVNICSTKVEYNAFKRVKNTRGLTLAEPKTSASLEVSAFQQEEQLKPALLNREYIMRNKHTAGSKQVHHNCQMIYHEGNLRSYFI